MSKLSLILAAALIPAAGLSLPAAARDRADDVQMTVPYHDLNLASVEGRAELDKRVRTAIDQMCHIEGRLTLRQRADSNACFAKAHRSVEPQLAALLNGSATRLADKDPPVLAAP